MSRILGSKLSNETKLKMRNAALGKPKSEEHRKHISEGHKGQVPWCTGKKKICIIIPDLCHCGCNEIVYGGKQYINGHSAKGNTNFLGKHHSEDSKKLLSKKLIGRIITEEHKEKISKKLKGRKLSEEHCKHSSEGHKNIIFSEERRKNISKALKGRIVSDEWKKHLSESHKGQHPVTEFKIGEFSGEKHYNWQGGLSFQEYPQTFNNKFREMIRERDNRMCQLCGKTEIDNKKRLTVHHIDYVKINIIPQNCITLCVSCNFKVNHNREYYKKLFKEKLSNILDCHII